jgi:RimJ/RimL family protein N-acetyltransferase
MQQPVIESKRLLLRPFQSGDAKDVQRLAGNINVSATTLNIPYPYYDGLAEEWISTHVDDWNNRTSMTYAITNRNNFELLGVMSLVSIHGTEAELGYWVGEPFWGNGYCTEAAKVFVKFVFTKIDILNISGEHLLSNVASGNVMKKIGMRYLKRTQKRDRNGVLSQLELYELTKTA